MQKVLVVAAHPDDEVLGCGATLNKFVKDGLDIRVVILGEGSSCRFDGKNINSKKVKVEIAKRKTFAIKSFKTLGIKDYHFHKLGC